MAADCKSAAPWSYEGSNPSLCTRIEMNRLWVALIAYAVIAVLTWQTISDQRMRWVTWAILAMFAIRTLAHSKLSDRAENGAE